MLDLNARVSAYGNRQSYDSSSFSLPALGRNGKTEDCFTGRHQAFRHFLLIHFFIHSVIIISLYSTNTLFLVIGTECLRWGRNSVFKCLVLSVCVPEL